MSLRTATHLLVFLFALVAGLYYAGPFLIPVVFGGSIAMLMLPVDNWLQQKGTGKNVSAGLSLLLFAGIVFGIIALLSWQVKGLFDDMNNIEQKMTGIFGQTKHWIAQTLHIPVQKQTQIVKAQQDSGMSGAMSVLMSVPGAIMSGLTDVIIVLVYIFLFLRFRLHIKRFLIKIVPEDSRLNTLHIIHQASCVTQKYLSGMGAMIFCLWIMYGIGFSIVGLQHALFFAVLCGTLELVPFVGNITGTILTALFALVEGSTGMVIGVLVTYGLVQTFQTYFLEPLIVGRQVNVHPMFTIIVLVLGEMIWGIPGMILSIPLLGMIKIVCDHVPALQPYGYLIGEEEKGNDVGVFTKWNTRLRRWIGKDAG